MESKKMVAKGENFLEDSLKFIREALEKKKVSKKNIIKAELLCEETIVLLAKNAPEDATLFIKVGSLLGDISVDLKMAGEEFSASPEGLMISEDLDDAESEDIIRSVFLKAYGEKYKYSHKNKTNKVRISVEKAGQSALYLTLFALFAGLVFGLLVQSVIPKPISTICCEYALRPVKTMFMNAIRIVIAPVVFFSMVTCIAQFKNIAELGKIAAKIMAVYMSTTIIATILGFGMAIIFKPAEWGFAIVNAPEVADIALDENVSFSLLDTIVNIVPDNFVLPFVEADTLQVMFLAIILGIAVGMIGEYSSVLKDFFEACNSLFLTVTTMIARFIPLAVFCSVSLMVVDMGGSSVMSMIKGVLVQIGTIVLMICIYGLLVCFVARLNPFRFFSNIKEGMLTSFTLSSSTAAMPTNLKICKEKLGVAPKLCNFTIPLGATVNMDGTCIYLSGFVLFIARAYGVQITSSMILSMALSIILLSLASPGVPGSALICMGVLLGQIGLPMEAVGLIIAITPIVDMFDTMSNTTGDMTATLIVARAEKMVDEDIFYGRK